MNILEELVLRRKELGLTQVDMAKRMGVTQASVSQFEGEDNDPKLSTLHRYARAVGLSVTLDSYQPTNEDVMAYLDEHKSRAFYDNCHDSVKADVYKEAWEQIKATAWKGGIK